MTTGKMQKKRPSRPPHKPKKRGNGEGSYYEDESRGCWFAAIPIGKTATGKVKVRKVRAASETDAKAKLLQLQCDRMKGRLVEPSRVTVKDVCKQWLDQRMLIRPSTRERSEQHLQHVIAILGDRRIQDIRSEDVSKLLNQLSQKQMQHGGVMSPITMRHIKTQLWGVFEYAIEKGLVHRNPVTKRIKIAGSDTIGGRPLTADQVNRLRQVGEAFYEAGLLRLWPAIATALWTGMRRAEVFALTWEDIDLRKGEVHVRHSLTRVKTTYVLDNPKTHASKRNLPLHPTLLTVLEEHCRTQQQQFKQDGLA